MVKITCRIFFELARNRRRKTQQLHQAYFSVFRVGHQAKDMRHAIIRINLAKYCLPYVVRILHELRQQPNRKPFFLESKTNLTKVCVQQPLFKRHASTI